MAESPSKQQETKAALLEAGAACFARRGFHATGVREICEAAGANPAAVNYHFGGKSEFYRAVMLHAFESASPPPPEMREGGERPEEQLRVFIRWFVDRMLRERGNNVVRDLLGHELREPTGALDLLIDNSMRPICRDLDGILARMLDADPEDEKVRLSSISILGQCLIYKQNGPVLERLHAPHGYGSESIDTVAEHIYRFTLAGLCTVAKGASLPPLSPFSVQEAG